MQSLSRMTAAGAALLGLVLVGACTPVNSVPTAPAAAQGNVDPTQPVKLALMVPLSADQQSASQLARALQNAAQMAVKEVNDPLLSLAVFDTGGDPDKARAVAQRAIQEDVKLFVGPLLGSSTKAVAAPAAQGDVKVLSFSTDTSSAGDPVYLSSFIPEVAARRITSYARLNGFGQMGVFYPQTAYGAQAIKGAQAGAGNAIVIATEYPRTNEELPPAAAKFAKDAKAAGARAVLLAESGQALKFVGGIMSQNGIRRGDVKYLGLGEWNSRATLDARDVRGGWFAAPDPTALRAFVNKYRATYGDAPPSLALLGYDAVKIAAQLLAEARQSGSRNPFSAEALTRPEGFRGIVGPIRFDANGIGTRGMAIMEVGRNSFKTVDPAPVAFGSGS